MQTSNGSLRPSSKLKIIWGISLSSIAYVLLLSGGETGLEALQSAAIIAALPFSFVIIMMMISFYKDANEEIIQIISQVKKEENSIIANFKHHGISIGNAKESQAILQLYNEYCTQNKCLQCAVGNSLLQGNS